MEDQNGLYKYVGDNTEKVENLLDNAIELKITGIIRQKADSDKSIVSGTVGYTKLLTDYIIEYTNNSKVVKAQEETPEKNVITGLKFKDLTGSYDDNMTSFGKVELDAPSSINIYADTFEEKDAITDCIEKYNETADENDKITYTDYVGLLMSSVTTIINTITYVLIAFVSISLVVSSIMIAIITYISVLERTKEIGILRAMGTSKNDVSKIFNAETFIEGLVAGLLGVGITILLNIPINMIIEKITGISGIAELPLNGGIILVIISVILTVIAGLVPAKMAAKKDPAVVLRSE